MRSRIRVNSSGGCGRARLGAAARGGGDVRSPAMKSSIVPSGGLGRKDVKQSELKSVRDELRKLHAKAPDNFFVNRFLASAYQRLKDEANYQAFLVQANKIRPTDIETARALFETYSKAIIELEEWFGHLGSRSHYVTFCPMAFDNRGASWLAREEQISNPYFGASMLRCGEVRDQASPRDDSGQGGGGQ